MLQCIFDYHCQKDGLLDCKGFITHFTPTTYNAAKTKQSLFAEGRKNKQKNKTQNVRKRLWNDTRAAKHNQKPPVLQLAPRQEELVNYGSLRE